LTPSERLVESGRLVESKRLMPPAGTMSAMISILLSWEWRFAGRGANLRARTGSVGGLAAVDVEDMAGDE
jgi:hypothetical protein